ncbi:MAG TPA: tetratricopeptide repeat protein, partial [Blastocatellia bacterium]|nr:tetratricopeptide repeat protein [Blastocatellia bacterium]
MPYLTSRWLQFIQEWARRAVIGLIVFAPMLAFAQSPEEPALRALVDKFFAAYQKEDINELQSMMDVKSPDFPATKQQIQKVFSDNEKIEIRNLTIRKLSPDGAKWTVRVSLEMSAVDEKTKAAAAGFGKMDFTLRAVKEDDGWKVLQFLPSAEDLAAVLVAARTDEERNLLLAADPDLVTTDLRKAVFNHAVRLLNQENYPQAIAIANFVISIAERIGEKAGIPRPLNLIGMVHKAQGNYPEALDYYQRSLKLAEQVGDKQVVPAVLNNVGLVLSGQGNYAQALESFQKSLVLSEAQGSKPTIARVLNNLGLVHFLQGNYAQALQYFQKGLTLKEQLNDKPGILTGLNNIGLVHFNQGNYTQALEYYQKTLAVAEELGNKEGLAAILINIGETYDNQNDYELALKTYQRSLA